jgi:glycosyltransferase involved in cell wall biosynthesis
VLPARLASKGTLYWMPLRRLLTAIRSFAPDLLHVEEEPYSIAALLCALVARHLGLPMTLFTWDNLQRRLPRPFEAVRRFVLSRAASVIAGNTDAAGLLRTWGFRGAVWIIPQLGVAPPSDAMRRSEAGTFCIGYIGRLVLEKGGSLLLGALAAIDGATLRIVGKGPDEGRLRHQAQTLGIASRVTFAGSLPHDRVGEELAKLDVLVLPSLTTVHWKEQFGHVLIEAMAAGVPVIGSSSGAIPEVIGNAGFVFAEGQVDELATRLRRLQDNPGLRRQLAAAGRARVVAEYTDEVLARRTFAVWESVLRSPSRPLGMFR